MNYLGIYEENEIIYDFCDFLSNETIDFRLKLLENWFEYVEICKKPLNISNFLKIVDQNTVIYDYRKKNKQYIFKENKELINDLIVDEDLWDKISLEILKND